MSITNEHPLRAEVKLLEIKVTEIARRYGCSTCFVQDVFAGRAPCPKRLKALIEKMLVERREYLKKVLDQ